MINNTEINTIVKKYFESAENKYDTLLGLRNSKGLLSDGTLLDSMSSHYRLEGIKLKNAIRDACREHELEWSEEEWKKIDTIFLGKCKLTWVPFQYYPADLGFDELREGVYVLKDRLDELFELYFHTEPVGKTFQLKLKLDNDGSFVWIDYSFSVRRVYAGSGRWGGYKTFYGTSFFRGYCGEVDIYLKEEKGSFKSVAYQKVYIRTEDPIWKKRKTVSEVCYRLDLSNDAKIDYRG